MGVFAPLVDSAIRFLNNETGVNPSQDERRTHWARQDRLLAGFFRAYRILGVIMAAVRPAHYLADCGADP